MDAFGLYMGPNNSFSLGSVEIIAELSGTANNVSPPKTFTISVDWDVGIIQSIGFEQFWFPYGCQFVFTPGAGDVQCTLTPSANASAGVVVQVSISASQISFSSPAAGRTVTACFLLLKRV